MLYHSWSQVTEDDRPLFIPKRPSKILWTPQTPPDQWPWTCECSIHLRILLDETALHTHDYCSSSKHLKSHVSAHCLFSIPEKLRYRLLGILYQILREYQNTTRISDLYYKSTLHNYDGHQSWHLYFPDTVQGDLAFVIHIFGLRLKLRLEAMTHLHLSNS